MSGRRLFEVNYRPLLTGAARKLRMHRLAARSLTKAIVFVGLEVQVLVRLEEALFALGLGVQSLRGDPVAQMGLPAFRIDVESRLVDY